MSVKGYADSLEVLVLQSLVARQELDQIGGTWAGRTRAIRPPDARPWELVACHTTISLSAMRI